MRTYTRPALLICLAAGTALAAPARYTSHPVAPDPTLGAAPPVSAKATAANLVNNGGFETNGGNKSSSFAGWQVINQSGGSGTWYALSDTTSPDSGYSVNAPPEGNFAAVTDQTGPGSHVLQQNITIPADGADVSFALMIKNRADAFSTPSNFDYNTIPNQQFKAQVIDPSSGSVIRTLYQTRVGDPLTTGYQVKTSTIPGSGSPRLVTLKFTEADNQSYFQLGIDDVVVTATGAPPAPVAPVIQIDASPSAIKATGTLTINWAVANSNSCVVGGGQAGSQFNVTQTATGGSATTTVTVGANTRNDVFTLTCTGNGGSTTASVVVAVGVPPPPAPTPITNPTKSVDGQPANAAAGNVALSDGGRYVVFESAATNLVPGDTNGTSDVFLRDTQQGTLVRISTDNGAQLNSVSGEAKISRNGKVVVFTRGTGQAAAAESKATKPITGGQMCLRDLNGATLVCVSKNPTNGAPGNGDSGNPSLSGDGKVVAFESTATNLTTTPDGNGAVKDVFSFDAKTNTTTILSNTDTGQPATAASSGPSVSCQGTSWAFESLAKLTNGTVEAGRRNIYTISPLAAKRLVSVGLNSTPANGDSRSPRITDDGRFVYFESTASNLVANDTNGVSDVFVADLVQNTIRRLSVSAAGVQANGASRAPKITCDGTQMTFESDATNLVSGDANGATDTFVLNVGTGSMALNSRTPSQPTTNGASTNAQIAPDGSAIGFDTVAPNLGGAPDKFVACTGVNPFASANYSGEWYDPAQSGHGLAIDQLADGRITAYWFTFDPNTSQAWFGGVGTLIGNTATVSVARPQGPRFIPNYNSADLVNTPIGTLTINFTACDRGVVNFALDSTFGNGSMTLQRLTSPVGVSCTPSAATLEDAVKLSAAPDPKVAWADSGLGGDGIGSKTIEPTQGPIANITGAWYDPNQSGHGLLFENLGNGVIAAAWFTQGPSGGQAWFSGLGTILDGNRARFDMSKPAGGRWIPNFNAALVTRPLLGTMEVNFSSCNAGVVNFTFDQGFGTNSMVLTPLFRPIGTICN